MPSHRSNSPTKTAAKLGGWLLVVVALVCAFAWIQFSSAVHVGDRFEKALDSETVARANTLEKYARRIAAAVGAEPRAEVIWAIGSALQQPVPPSVSIAAPVAHALLVHTSLASSDVVETVLPIVEAAQAALAADTARAKVIRDAYREELTESWSGAWLRYAGFPRSSEALITDHP